MSEAALAARQRGAGRCAHQPFFESRESSGFFREREEAAENERIEDLEATIQELSRERNSAELEGAYRAHVKRAARESQQFAPQPFSAAQIDDAAPQQITPTSSAPSAAGLIADMD